MNAASRPKIASAARVAICWPTIVRASEPNRSSYQRARQVARSIGSRPSINRAITGSDARSASLADWAPRPFAATTVNIA